MTKISSSGFYQYSSDFCTFQGDPLQLKVTMSSSRMFIGVSSSMLVLSMANGSAYFYNRFVQSTSVCSIPQSHIVPASGRAKISELAETLPYKSFRPIQERASKLFQNLINISQSVAPSLLKMKINVSVRLVQNQNIDYT